MPAPGPGSFLVALGADPICGERAVFGAVGAKYAIAGVTGAYGGIHRGGEEPRQENVFRYST